MKSIDGARRLAGPSGRALGWPAGIALTFITAGGGLAGSAGMVIGGLLAVVAIPIAGFTWNQVKLTGRGREVARTVEDVRVLKASDAAAFGAILRRADPPLALVGAGPVPAPPVLATPEPRPGEPFWSSLTTAEQRALGIVARPDVFGEGALLCQEGRLGDRLFVIRSGFVKVCVATAGGERIVSVRGPGDLVGERAALLVRARSAAVVALDTVRALVLHTADFTAFLEEHPRVMSVLERQVYDRLTEPRGAAIAATPSWTGQNCSIFFADVAGFGALRRDDEDRRVVRRVMYEVLLEAFDGSGVRWTACHREDRGDGALVIVPPSVPTRLVVEPLLSRLAAGLHRHNRRASPAVRTQLRVAVHVGPVDSDPQGVSGAAILHAARMLEASVLKERLAETGADLGFITSPFVYDTVVRHAPGAVDPATYRAVDLRVKESNFTAWIQLL